MPVPKGFREKAADFPASKCDQRSFRIKTISGDTRLVVCCPRNRWNAKRKRCTVGTRATKIQTRISGKKHR